MTMAPKLPVLSVHADCSPDIGYGHVMRCIGVAGAISKSGAMGVRFLTSADSDAGLIEGAGLAVQRLHGGRPVAAAIEAIVDAAEGPLLLDTYGVTTPDLKALNDAGFAVAMFDDGRRLENYPCALVIDSAPGAEGLTYHSTTDARFCLGPSFYPLRAEFQNVRLERTHSKAPDRLLVTFGGSDPDDQTARVLRIITERAFPWEVTAVLGPGYEGDAEAVSSGCANIHLKRNGAPMASLMAAADMAISSAGGTALELAYMGTPTVLMTLSRNQERIAEALDQMRAALSLGAWQDRTDADIANALLALGENAEQRMALSDRARSVVDGHGIGRIAAAISETWSGSHMTERGLES